MRSRIVGLRPRVARRADARAPAERVDLEPRVVGERRQPGRGRHGARLRDRVLARTSRPAPPAAGDAGKRVERDHLDRRPTRGRARASSATFPRFARREDEPGGIIARRGGDSRAPRSVSRWQARERAHALRRRARASRVELPGRERLPLGRPLHLDEAARAGHDDVQVDLGALVLLVGEVEEHASVDDADADRRDAAR